jgi:ubiquinone biosynthesis protein UbiJ
MLNIASITERWRIERVAVLEPATDETGLKIDVLAVSGIQEEIDALEDRIHQLEQKVEDLEASIPG